MTVFARVVVGVDGTEWGSEALRQTLRLAPADGSSIRAVTALDTAPAAHTGFEAGRWVDILAAEADEARAEAATLLEGRADATATVVRGNALAVLRAARDEWNATLVSLGGRHSSRFLGALLGGTSTELLHDAASSLLLARPATPGESPRQAIVVGHDGSEHADAALAAAEEIGARVALEVEVVRAENGAPVAALVERSRAAALVVVGSRGLHGVRALGSVSERVAHQAQCSVLVVRSR